MVLVTNAEIFVIAGGGGAGGNGGSGGGGAGGVVHVTSHTLQASILIQSLYLLVVLVVLHPTMVE